MLICVIVLLANQLERGFFCLTIYHSFERLRGRISQSVVASKIKVFVYCYALILLLLIYVSRNDCRGSLHRFKYLVYLAEGILNGNIEHPFLTETHSWLQYQIVLIIGQFFQYYFSNKKFARTTATTQQKHWFKSVFFQGIFGINLL